jgi:tetratricopeptide (TPR) repeat protein
MRTLASFIAAQRKFAEAEALFAQIIELRKQAFGEQHLDTQKSMLDLALMYIAVGKFDKAEPLAAEVVATHRKLGAGTKDTVTAMLVLASIRQQQKKLPQALELANRAYETSRRSLGENDAVTLAAKVVSQKLNAQVNPKEARADRAGSFADQSRILESVGANSIPQMIGMALTKASVAFAQGQPAQAEPDLIAALEASRRAGSEDVHVLGLAAIYAVERKFADAEETYRKVAGPLSASKEQDPFLLRLVLRSLANAYRTDGKFAEAEPHSLKLVALMRTSPGDSSQLTRADILCLAEIYVGERKFPNAEDAYRQVLAAQRQYVPQQINTVVTVSNIGCVQLQQKRYADAEKTLREAAQILTSTSPQACERYYVDSMLGASLAAQKRFAEAEPLLVSGYEGMARSGHLGNVSTNSRFTEEQAAEATAQLYADWANPIDKRMGLMARNTCGWRIPD